MTCQQNITNNYSLLRGHIFPDDAYIYKYLQRPYEKSCKISISKELFGHPVAYINYYGMVFFHAFIYSSAG